MAGLATEGVGVLFTKDANGDVVAGSVEIIHWTGVAGSSLTLTNTGDRGLTGSDSGAQAFSSGAYFEVWVTSYYYKSLRDGIVAADFATATVAATGKTTPVDADLLAIVDSAASNVIKKLTWANLKATLKTYFDTLYMAITTVDGWTASSASWTYLSASSVTVPSGAASLYQKGTRVKFTQTTVKYFVVVGVTDTTLTFAVNNDYTVANAAISAISYSHQLNPIGWPTWFGYDPTWTGFSAAPTQDVLYRINGNEITLLLNDQQGTSNSATLNFTLPVAPSTPGSATQDNLCIYLDNGTWAGPGVIGIFDGNITANVGKTIGSIAAAAYGGFTASAGKGVAATLSYRF